MSTCAGRCAVNHVPYGTGQAPYSGLSYRTRCGILNLVNTKTYFVYILTNNNRKVYYTGITNNLRRRVYEHKNKLVIGFTEKYNITDLIYYEIYDSIELAIKREKLLKKWKRPWKDKIIKQFNPSLVDLYNDL